MITVFILGVIIGVPIGMFIFALCRMAKSDDKNI